MLDTERSNSYKKDPENHYAESNSRVWINQVNHQVPNYEAANIRQSGTKYEASINDSIHSSSIADEDDTKDFLYDKKEKIDKKKTAKW